MPNIDDVRLAPIETKRVRIGQKFGRLTVEAVGKVIATRRYYAVCACRCGAKRLLVQIAHLEAGSTKSCGCQTKDRMTTHGLSIHPVFKRWQGMMARCYYPSHPSYPNYGGRGIKVCKRWHNPAKFIADMSADFSPDLELDRRKTDGDYKPSNCRWIPKRDNIDNRRASRRVSHNGKSLTLREWARRTGISAKLLAKRLFERGWSADRAFATPVLSTVEAAKVANAASQVMKRSKRTA